MTRLRRSELSTPGTNPKMLAKAAASEADLVFCDLEDSVAPAEKAGARATVVAALRELDWGKKLCGVRVNATDTPWCHDDVIEVVTGAADRLDVLIVPKVKAARDVWFVDTLLTQLEAKLGLARPIGLEVLIEEVEGVVNAEEIARCSPRVEALILGFGDLAASQGVRVRAIGAADGGYPGDLWHYARTKVVVAARAAGVDAIDGPFADFRDPDGYRREADRSATLGFVGKWAIHPSQVALANGVYSPTEEEVASARRVIDAVAEAEAAGQGAAAYGGAMVDAATARILRNVVERARVIDERS